MIILFAINNVMLDIIDYLLAFIVHRILELVS